MAFISLEPMTVLMTKLPRAGRGVPVKEWGELCHTHWLSVGFLGPAVALSTSGLSPEQALTQLSARLCLKDPVTVPVLLASCLLCGSNLGLFFFGGGEGGLHCGQHWVC